MRNDVRINKSADDTGVIVELNDNPVKCKSVTVNAAVGRSPVVNLELIPWTADILLTDADVYVSMDPKTVKEANIILCHELMTHGDYFYGFKASIESALTECTEITNVSDLAEFIIDRLVGYVPTTE